MNEDYKLKEEVETIEVEDFISDKEDALQMISIFVEDEEELKLRIIRDLKKENRALFKARIIDIFSLEKEVVSYYSERIKYTDKQLDLIIRGISYQKSLMRLINDDNYLELYKFSKVLDRNLILNYNYYEDLINGLYYSFLGISYIPFGSCSVNNHIELFNLLDLEVSKYDKAIAKVKKM